MNLILGIVELALSLYGLLIFARIILSWLPLRSGTAAYKLHDVLHDLTEPYLRVFRSFLPRVRLGNAGFDLSPMAGLIALVVAERLVVLL